MSKKLDEELLDIAKWFTYHKDECTDIHKRVAFLENACDHLIWVLGRVCQDIQTLERRKAFQNMDELSNIVIPHGVKLHDGIRNRG